MSPLNIPDPWAALIRDGRITVAALSIWQPWAWLIANGHKDVENRDWRTRRRGPTLIHASLKVDRDAEEDLRSGRHPVTGGPLALDLPEAFDRGGIVGMADITDCVTASPSEWFVGRYGFVMRGARPLPFRAVKGARGFFEPTFLAQAPPPKPARSLFPEAT